jgi:hypothetical protein
MANAFKTLWPSVLDVGRGQFFKRVGDAFDLVGDAVKPFAQLKRHRLNGAHTGRIDAVTPSEGANFQTDLFQGSLQFLADLHFFMPPFGVLKLIIGLQPITQT